MTKRQPIPFGKYLLLDRVNIGGMAEVWKAKTFGAEGFEKLVAIKRILPNIAEDAEFITMFIDEAKISVHLTHANVAQVFDLGKIGDSYYIAMEYVSGRDLRAIFDKARKRGEPAPIPLTCFALSKASEGLDYAHRKKDAASNDLNIVHRDVSPQNILCSFDGEVKVIDFGIAKAANKATKTQAGILKGKFGYMSPEQVRGLPLDRRSDIFALGVVLYEMLTGERLFVGESDFSVLEKVRAVDILPPSTYNRRIPAALEKIVLRALAKDVEERFQYASELGDELQRFLITNDTIFSRKDLMQFMKSTFAEDVEREKQKLQEYQDVKLPPGIAALAGQAGNAPGRPPQLAPQQPAYNQNGAPAAEIFERSERTEIGSMPASDSTNPVYADPQGPGPAPVFSSPPRSLSNPGNMPAAFAGPGIPGPPILGGGGRPAVLAGPPNNGAAPTAGIGRSPTFTPGTAPPINRRPPSAQNAAPPHAAPNVARPNVAPMKPPSGSAGIAADLDAEILNNHEAQAGPGQDAQGDRSSAVHSPGRIKLILALAVGGLVLALTVVALVVVLGKANGTLLINVNPTTELTIILDNQMVASSTPYVNPKVPVGKHNILITARGFETYQQQIEVTKEAPVSIDVSLKRPSANVRATVQPDPPGAEISVDGKVVHPSGATTSYSAELDGNAQHAVVVKLDGFKAATKTFGAGEAIAWQVKLEPDAVPAPAPAQAPAPAVPAPSAAK